MTLSSFSLREKVPAKQGDEDLAVIVAGSGPSSDASRATFSRTGEGIKKNLRPHFLAFRIKQRLADNFRLAPLADDFDLEPVRLIRQFLRHIAHAD